MKRLLYITLFLFCNLEAISIDPTFFNTCFYNKDQDFLFLNAPKCGSTYIRNALGRTLSGTDLTTLPKKDKEAAITLLVVRDPMIRAISSYLEVIKCRKDGHQHMKNMPFYLNRKLVLESFEGYLEELKNGFFDEHCYPQHSILAQRKIALEDITFIIDMRHITKDLKFFCETFDVPLFLRPGIYRHPGDARKKKRLRDFVLKSPRIQNLIREVYREDFLFYEACKKRRAELLETYRFS